MLPVCFDEVNLAVVFVQIKMFGVQKPESPVHVSPTFTLTSQSETLPIRGFDDVDLSTEKRSKPGRLSWED